VHHGAFEEVYFVPSPKYFRNFIIYFNWSCGICGGQSGDGAGFLRVLRFTLPIFIPPISPQSPSSIIWGWYNRSVVAAVPSGLSLTPLTIIKRIKFKNGTTLLLSKRLFKELDWLYHKQYFLQTIIYIALILQRNFKECSVR
jgi:hypothetical protein